MHEYVSIVSYVILTPHDTTWRLASSFVFCFPSPSIVIQQPLLAILKADPQFPACPRNLKVHRPSWQINESWEILRKVAEELGITETCLTESTMNVIPLFLAKLIA
jgi:hypothetical protein